MAIFCLKFGWLLTKVGINPKKSIIGIMRILFFNSGLNQQEIYSLFYFPGARVRLFIHLNRMSLFCN
ncbi:hypothetical protein BTJ39_05705 [Izhakiella australiensis]|uniref:Uncharacterized protein n=1 Tax=Izhakiella australiensis TaxID=1926881 RepID=A0A1S8YRK8_9GAMM|nr:hypothetical protein BTJ39_05705 [Izhakiella australiensis]